MYSVYNKNTGMTTYHSTKAEADLQVLQNMTEQAAAEWIAEALVEPRKAPQPKSESSGCGAFLAWILIMFLWVITAGIIITFLEPYTPYKGTPHEQLGVYLIFGIATLAPVLILVAFRYIANRFK